MTLVIVTKSQVVGIVDKAKVKNIILQTNYFLKKC